MFHIQEVILIQLLCLQITISLKILIWDLLFLIWRENFICRQYELYYRNKYRYFSIRQTILQWERYVGQSLVFIYVILALYQVGFGYIQIFILFYATIKFILYFLFFVLLYFTKHVSSYTVWAYIHIIFKFKIFILDIMIYFFSSNLNMYFQWT